ncbi:anoctamin 8 white walker isoform 3-T4 [Glossina fuscipes fuscipes]
MNKSIENLLQQNSGEMSSERQSSEDVQESTTTADDAAIEGDGDFTDDNNFESNLRRRKGKIISCAKETIENASRHFRRKVPYAGHLMTPRRLWLNKIPTQCDVVIEFPEDAPDEALRWLLTRIRSQPSAGLGLVVQVKAHESSRRNAFYITAPTNILFRAAEEARLPKRLRPDLGGALREFTTRESHCFQQLKSDESSTNLFTSQERQWLVLQVLQGMRASPTDVEALQGRAAVDEGQSIVAAWQETGLITQIFPLHETKTLTQLQRSWVKQIFAPQPLDDIAEYFGVKVALYFAWLGHYTSALGVPAVFGSILYIILWGKGQTAQDMGHVLFSLFNVAWASLYLEAWKRYSVELAFRWGTLSTPPELLEPPRPLYKGSLVENNVTGRLEPKEAPAWKRRAFRYLVSFPIIGLCLLLVFVVMFLMLRFQDWWDSKLPVEGVVCCLSVIPKVLLAGAITLMDEAYYKLAVWLNDKENYRLQSKYENHLIAKVALFQFVNSFLSLFYIAFYLRDEEKLKEQLAGLLISRQIIGNLRESAIPYFVEQWRLAKLSFTMWGALSPTQSVNRSILDSADHAPNGNGGNNAEKPAPETGSAASTPQTVGTPSKQMPKKSVDSIASVSTQISSISIASSKRNIGQAEIESSLYKVNRSEMFYYFHQLYDGTFSDHLEMLVQMGYVVLFSAAFPLAGICALINNLMEIRSDAFKLAHVHQRPFGQRVANIGTWQNALSLLSLAAVIVNCALIGLSGQVSRLWPGLTTVQTIILIVTLEHIMLALRSALTWLLPELPSWLAAEIARAEHCRREMQCKGTSPRPTPPTPPSTTSTPAEHELSTLNMEAVRSGKDVRSTEAATTTSEQTLNSQISVDVLYQQQAGHLTSNYESYLDDISRYGLRRNVETEENVFVSRDSTPDSPPSQTSTILIRPLHESTPPNSGASLTSLNQDLSHGLSGACKSCKQKKKILEIPPFRGYSFRNLSSIPKQRLHVLTGGSASSTSSLALNARQNMHIPDIPPFRKKSSDSAEHTGSSASSSPQRTRQPIFASSSPPLPLLPPSPPPPPPQPPLTTATTTKISEIPPFKPRKISAESTMHLNMSEKYPQKTHAPEWMSRLKVSDNINLHRSIDCIAKELKSTTDTMDILKPAPSWSNVTMKAPQQITQQQQQHTSPLTTAAIAQQSHTSAHIAPSSSSSSGGGVSVTGAVNRTEIARASVSSMPTSSSNFLQQQQSTDKEQPSTSQQQQQQQQVSTTTKSGSGSATTPGGCTDDETKAAELAAKKSRLKQKLVKSARSVAIFSLKLKERRQREAEKAAAIAVEHAKALAKLPPLPQPGGELSLIPIEQLIKIEDIKPPTLKSPPTSSTTTATSLASLALVTTGSSAVSSAITTTTATASTTSSALLAAAAAHLQQQQQQQQQSQYHHQPQHLQNQHPASGSF